MTTRLNFNRIFGGYKGAFAAYANELGELLTQADAGEIQADQLITKWKTLRRKMVQEHKIDSAKLDQAMICYLMLGEDFLDHNQNSFADEAPVDILQENEILDNDLVQNMKKGGFETIGEIRRANDNELLFVQGCKQEHVNKIRNVI